MLYSLAPAEENSPGFTVNTNIMFGLLRGGFDRGAAESKTLQWIGLVRFENAYLYQLSGGLKQRIAIATRRRIKELIHSDCEGK